MAVCRKTVKPENTPKRMTHGEQVSNAEVSSTGQRWMKRSDL